MKGVQEIAMENERVVVTGHAAEVGIVGWCMGGQVYTITYHLDVDKNTKF